MKGPKGWIEIMEDHCKGCLLCIEDCPNDEIEVAPYLNRKGFRPALPKNEECSGCGICFYSCPEPRAIRVFKTVAERKRA